MAYIQKYSKYMTQWPYTVKLNLTVLSVAAFNVGEYRRAATKLTDENFFRSDNPQAEELRT